MDYTADITVPKNTTEKNPVVHTIVCGPGILHEWVRWFPEGGWGYVRFNVWQGGHQFLPSTETQSYRGNNSTIRKKVYFPLPRAENTIKIKAWNIDDTYDHTISLEFSVLQEDILAFGTLMSRVPNLVRKVLLGRNKSKEVN